MPSAIMPDRNIPIACWEHHMFKVESFAELARKNNVDATALGRTVACMNDYSGTGKDVEFARVATVYDRTFGNPNARLNLCLGSI